MTVVNVSREKIGILITTWQLMKLAFPMFLSSASWVSTHVATVKQNISYSLLQVGMKATDTAILGHLGTNDTLYLSAVASADLWTSSTGVFIQGRVLGTFVGQAIGAGHRDMAGVWLQVRDCNGISKLPSIQLIL